MAIHADAARAYLDHASGPILEPRVRTAMAGALALDASPDGLHEAAREPALVLEGARTELAGLLGADDPDEVIFTSGSTEARNLAVKGLMAGNAALGGTVVVATTEHPALRSAARTAAERVVEVGVSQQGVLDPDEIRNAVDADTAIVVLHHGHEEIGTLQDLPPLVAAARAARSDVRIVIDAGATAGVLPLDVRGLDVDAVVVGGPSMGAPAWTGALWLRPGARMHPLIEGGTQELGKRAGAQSVPGIAALGAAAALRRADGAERAARMDALGGRLIESLVAIPHVRLNGSARARVPGHVQVSAAGVSGDTLAASLGARGVCVAPGSSCTGAAGRASQALQALGLDEAWTRSAILMTLGTQTTAEQIELAATAVAEEVERLRAMAPGGAMAARGR